MIDLREKIAIVTGSSRGIGAGIAQTLASLGATVVINHRNSPAAAAETLHKIEAAGGQGMIVQADVSDAKAATQLVKATQATYGRIDILVNNAGITRDKLIMMMKEDDWDTVMQANLRSMFLMSKAVARPMMKKRTGRIINITSVVGLAGQAGQTNYAASKAGIIGFTKSLAKELGARNITVNAIAPGFVPTDLTASLDDKLINTAIEMTPLGRLGSVADIGYAVAFLAADEAAFITGQVLSVDGGLVMQ